MTWFYKDQEFTEDMIGDNFGFVYHIQSLVTGKSYIGKKFFTKAKTKQVKGKKKKTRVSSDWQDYFGSNAALVEEVKYHGPEKYRRTILYLCASRGECSYYETKEIFARDALLRNDYYNQWVSAKIQRTHLKKLQQEIL
jgi:hypothetical protein